MRPVRASASTSDAWNARRRSLGTRLVAVVVAAGVLSGCGVSLQDRPVRVEADLPSARAPTSPGGGVRPFTIYLVRSGRLEAVERSAASLSLSTMLTSLAGGPTFSEAATGTHTALSPQPFAVGGAVEGSPTVTVAANRSFTSISGDDQLLAAAQLVWTVTEPSGIDHVTVVVDGAAIELPTDHGLVGGPVDRADYMSVAPSSSAREP